MKYKVTLGILLAMIACLLLAACGELKETPDARVERLGKLIRCPVCRGVPIGDSPSELSKQMMTMVNEQVAAGKSDDEILFYFEQRYGEWALLDPKPEGMNLLIWVLPLCFALGGAGFIVAYVRKGKERQD